MNDCFGANKCTSELRPSWQVHRVSQIHSLSCTCGCKGGWRVGLALGTACLPQLFLTFSPLTLPIPVTYPFLVAD